MKKILLAVTLVSLFLFSNAQTDNKISIGTIDSVQSNILNEKRKIWVYVPNGGANNNQVLAQQKYPVVYLLDGNRHFHSVTGMFQQLSQVNSNTMCPEMIVVGILNTVRERDLTPTKAGDDPFMKEIGSFKNTGGGEAFISFIEKELMPYIDSKYPTQSYKMLIGHSFGGLTVMNTAINHTKLFNTYIANDPSMWWDDLKFLKASKKGLAEKNFAGTTLYVGIANTMDEGMDVKKVAKDTTLINRGIQANLELDNFIKKQKPKGLRYASKYYHDDTHNSVPLIATYDGLRFIFKDYEFKLRNKDVLDSTVAFAEKLKLRYEKISKLYAYEVKPPEMEINIYGYRFLQRKQFKKAEDLFKLNMHNYPQSANVYDAYGDFFVATGDKTKAVEQFKKALSIKEDTATRAKLKKLEEQL